MILKINWLSSVLFGTKHSEQEKKDERHWLGQEANVYMYKEGGIWVAQWQDIVSGK